MKPASTIESTSTECPNSRQSSPDHYSRLSPQPIEVIEAWGLDFEMGSALKYIARAGHKEDELRDLRKAIWFLNRKLEVREAQLAGLQPPAPSAQA